MTYNNEYHDAERAVKAAFMWALENEENESTLSELWRHYLGIKTIAKSQKLVESFVDFNLDTPGDSPFDNYGAAGPVDWNLYGDGAYVPGGMGQDVITFSS